MPTMSRTSRVSFYIQVSDEAILSFIEQEELVATKEVAVELDYHIQTARRRLRGLHHEGEIWQKDVSKDSFGGYLTDFKLLYF